MNLIRKALWPTALVAVFLLALGAMGKANTAQASEIESVEVAGSPHVFDTILAAPGPFAVWIVVGDDDDDTYAVEVNSESGSADIIAILDGDGSGDLDDDINPTQETGPISVVDLCDPDQSLEAELIAVGAGDAIGIGDDCENHDGSEEGIVLVVVECDDLGTFDISFVNQDDDDDSRSIEIECRGNAASGEIAADPDKVEIIPQFGSQDWSEITVTVFDAAGEAAAPGDEVLFLTDNCELSDDNVETEYDEPSDSTTATTILDCSDPDESSPGTAEITAIIEKTGADIVLSTSVTVVGPPVANGFSAVASPETVVCGEKASILVTVLDAIGQNVSDNTPVEAVTNFGGVIGGAGTLATGLGPVSPVSSALGFTNDGVVEFFVITSDTHVGNYEVLLTTGNMVTTDSDIGDDDAIISFQGVPFSTQVSIECTEPAAPPTVTAPSTGGGITPPSTGDAGLAQTSSSSWTLLAVAGALASVVGLVVAGKTKLFNR